MATNSKISRDSKPKKYEFHERIQADGWRKYHGASKEMGRRSWRINMEENQRWMNTYFMNENEMKEENVGEGGAKRHR